MVYSYSRRGTEGEGPIEMLEAHRFKGSGGLSIKEPASGDATYGVAQESAVEGQFAWVSEVNRGTLGAEAVWVASVNWGRYEEMDEEGESEALRRLSMNALEDEWDDDDPDRTDRL